MQYCKGQGSIKCQGNLIIRVKAEGRWHKIIHLSLSLWSTKVAMKAGLRIRQAA